MSYYNVGNTATLPVACSSGSVIYSYVWNFWDGSSTATKAPVVSKLVNMGGNPNNGQLLYTCTPVALDGQYVTLSGSIMANNPTTILTGARISVNDAVYPFTTQLSLTALDLENDSLLFKWYQGAQFIGNGSVYSAGTCSGTWIGNGTSVVVGRPAYTSALAYTALSDQTLTCLVEDTRGGTNALSFNLRGSAPTTPDSSIYAAVTGLTFDASALPTALIGPGQSVAFTVNASPAPGYTLNFSWNFYGSNRWTVPGTAPGVTTIFANGGYQNIATKDISGELVGTGTSKEVTAAVTVTATNVLNGAVSSTTLTQSIALVANSAPSGVSVGRYISGIPVTAPVAAGSLIEYVATGTDANNSLLSYRWLFAQPFSPATVYYYGPKLIYDTGAYSSGQTVQGQLTVTDRLGASITTALPATIIA